MRKSLLLMVGAVGVGAAGLTYEVRAQDAPKQDTKPVPAPVRDLDNLPKPTPAPYAVPATRLEQPKKTWDATSKSPPVVEARPPGRGTERETVEQLRRALKEGDPQTTALPVGRWTLEFSNGVKEVREIHKDGTVSAEEAKRKSDGKAAVKDGVIVVVFRDDRVERWTPVGQKMVVEHWGTAADYASVRPVLGIAEWLPTANTPLSPGGLGDFRSTPKPREVSPGPR